ncbi:Ras family protein [Ancylostoma ceylanicum]|uniref:Ras family protein n=1 Tax=Ancylostoma ceylanicum TaxID=53326 RepID=A0A0D6L5I6_9BILA|nr:Ras family protein [Ancylostoma ceylanicum]
MEWQERVSLDWLVKATDRSISLANFYSSVADLVALDVLWCPEWSEYYRGTHGVVVVYDVTNGESFSNVKRWLHEIDANCESVQKILVGNKNEDPTRRIVLESDARQFADTMHIKFFETSAKENSNVEELLHVDHRWRPTACVIFEAFILRAKRVKPSLALPLTDDVLPRSIAPVSMR